MFKNYRRPIATFMAAVSLYSAVTPTVAMAQAAKVSARQRALAMSERVELLNFDGVPEQHFAGNNFGARLTEVSGAFRSINPASRDSMRARLRTLSGWNNNKVRQATAELLLILDATAASTRSEYYAAVHRLPVTVTRSAGRDDLGREGTWTEYQHARGHTMRIFALTKASDSSPSSESEPRADQTSNSDLASSVSSSVATPSSIRDFCEYTDEDSVYWSGDCMTSEDYEAGAIELTSASAAVGEIEEATDDVVDSCSYNEQTELYLCTRLGDVPSLSIVGSSVTISEGSAGEMAPSEPSDGFAADPTPLTSCTTHIVQNAVSVGSFALKWLRASNIFATVEVPLVAGATGIAEMALAAGAVAFTAYTLYQCLSDNNSGMM